MKTKTLTTLMTLALVLMISVAHAQKTGYKNAVKREYHDRRENVRDHREDHRDRREDVRDRKEDKFDRREDV
ncbi:MAG: hypothetical protein ACK5OP_03670, partial [Sphingobacteriales bacterium]